MTKVRMSDGAELFVKILGGENASKPLMIVHHGAPGISSHAEPEASFGFLADRYRVLVFDARGSGTSALQPPYTHARWAKDVDELREWAGAKQFLIAGGSYGGFISLEYALAYPDRLTGIILRDTTAYGPGMKDLAIANANKSKRVKLDPERQDRLWRGATRDDEDFKTAFAEISSLYSAAEPSEPVAPGQIADGFKDMRFHAETHNAAFSEGVPNYDLRSRLGEIRVPTLVTVGRHDWITPVVCSEEIARGIPSSQLVIFENSGHSPPGEEPEAFQATVREFLRKAGL